MVLVDGHGAYATTVETRSGSRYAHHVDPEMSRAAPKGCELGASRRGGPLGQVIGYDSAALAQKVPKKDDVVRLP